MVGRDQPEFSRIRDDRVRLAVDAWLRWLPRWSPGTVRGRARICRKCYGSPFAEAAGFTDEVPHAVQHALIMRLDRIVEDAVDDYTRHNLPLLESELDHQERRRRARPYRPEQDLDPEYRGLDLDPEADPEAPFLFTIAELAEQVAREAPPPEPLPELTPDAKDALRFEIRLSDEVAVDEGRLVCLALAAHRERISRGIAECVEPQIQALLEELSHELGLPPAR